MENNKTKNALKTIIWHYKTKIPLYLEDIVLCDNYIIKCNLENVKCIYCNEENTALCEECGFAYEKTEIKHYNVIGYISPYSSKYFKSVFDTFNSVFKDCYKYMKMSLAYVSISTLINILTVFTKIETILYYLKIRKNHICK